jgi:WD40 repeat protein
MKLNIYLLFRFITGSYDRTCKVWNTITGDELLSLEGHKNVVYCMAFNNPFGYIELLSNVLILAIE